MKCYLCEFPLDTDTACPVQCEDGATVMLCFDCYEEAEIAAYGVSAEIMKTRKASGPTWALAALLLDDGEIYDEF